MPGRPGSGRKGCRSPAQAPSDRRVGRAWFVYLVRTGPDMEKESNEWSWCVGDRPHRFSKGGGTDTTRNRRCRPHRFRVGGENLGPEPESERVGPNLLIIPSPYGGSKMVADDSGRIVAHDTP